RAAITSPLLEASIEGARGILLNIAGGSDLGLFEVNEAAEIIHGVAHADANIIFGSVIDDAMGDEVRVTVIAAGFDRWEEETPKGRQREAGSRSAPRDTAPRPDPFAMPADEEIDLGDDEFDVPSFLR
ncbi:MAG: cell division protein FtsZ, partial [Acidimicrobiales bacterium]